MRVVPAVPGHVWRGEDGGFSGNQLALGEILETARGLRQNAVRVYSLA